MDYVGIYIGYFLLIFDSGLIGFSNFWIMKRPLLDQTFIRTTCYMYLWYTVKCNPITEFESNFMT